MSTSAPFGTLRRTFFSLLSAMALLAGCASTPRVDWNSRIGTFTYDQVVTEMGPPDKSTKLSDGSTVAEWFVKRGSSFAFGVGTGFYGGGSGVGVGQTVGTAPSGQYLRLNFGADGKLTKWDRVRH